MKGLKGELNFFFIWICKLNLNINRRSNPDLIGINFKKAKNGTEREKTT